MNSQTQRPSPDPEKIRSMFAKVAAKYDKANSVLSVGIHHLWRKKLVALSGAKPGMKVLDCATGTGDLAIEFKKTVGFKPTSSIKDIAKKGRHDPCIIPRAIPVIEAICWHLLADHWLWSRTDKI